VKKGENQDVCHSEHLHWGLQKGPLWSTSHISSTYGDVQEYGFCTGWG